MCECTLKHVFFGSTWNGTEPGRRRRTATAATILGKSRDPRRRPFPSRRRHPTPERRRGRGTSTPLPRVSARTRSVKARRRFTSPIALAVVIHVVRCFSVRWKTVSSKRIFYFLRRKLPESVLKKFQREMNSSGLSDPYVRTALTLLCTKGVLFLLTEDFII